MLFQYVVHPRGLDPFQAAKAWHLRVEGGLPWKAVRAQVHTVSGVQPGQDAIEDAVARIGAQCHTRSLGSQVLSRASITDVDEHRF